MEHGCDAGRDRAQLAAARRRPDAIRTEYARWFADPGHFDDLRRCPLGDGTGEVVEYTLSWQENGMPHAAHHMHLLTVRDDQIVADTVMCGGRWPAGLLPRWKRPMSAHDRPPETAPRDVGDLGELLAEATSRTVLDEAPGSPAPGLSEWSSGASPTC